MSATSAVGNAVGTGGVFLRKATGLVREVSMMDALIMNTLGMNVAVGAVFLFLQAPADFPNGNMLVAVVIGTLLMAFTLLWVYSEFAAAMPRSGGDYIFVSRALHPFLGWLLSWSQGLWLIFFWIGFNAWFALTFAVPTALSTISVATGQSAWGDASNSLVSTFSVAGITTQWWVLVYGTLINVAFGALLLFGNRSYWRLQRFLFIFAGGSILIAVGLLLFKGGDIPSAWNAFAAKAGGLPFDQIIPMAKSQGYTPPDGSFDFGQTLLMLPWVFFVVGYAQGSAQPVCTRSVNAVRPATPGSNAAPQLPSPSPKRSAVVEGAATARLRMATSRGFSSFGTTHKTLGSSRISSGRRVA